MPSGVGAAKNLKRIAQSLQPYRIEQLNAGDIVMRNDGTVPFRVSCSGKYQVSMQATIQRTPIIYSNGGSYLRHEIHTTFRLEKIKPLTPEEFEATLYSLGTRKIQP